MSEKSERVARFWAHPEGRGIRELLVDLGELAFQLGAEHISLDLLADGDGFVVVKTNKHAAGFRVEKAELEAFPAVYPGMLAQRLHELPALERREHPLAPEEGELLDDLEGEHPGRAEDEVAAPGPGAVAAIEVTTGKGGRGDAQGTCG